ncbi:MAG: hypothetical protein LBP59_03350 [Planctomycetaceae bacterium]|nr:hypothetical protein [Planctomycetaceae bacterium]
MLQKIVKTDRGRLACKRLYSTAVERGLTAQPPCYLPIGKVQAGRPRSVGLACFTGSRASRLQAVVLNRK